MATTITPGTLTVKITETVALNGTNMDATNSLTIGSINEINQRIVTIPPGTKVVIYEFGAIVGPGKFVYANAEYFRLTNKDDALHVNVNLTSATTNQWQRVGPGQSLMCSMLGVEGVASGTVTGMVAKDITAIEVQNDDQTVSVDIDCYVGLT